MKHLSITDIGRNNYVHIFQPRISVAQEEADIKSMIDREYERKEQEERDYYKSLEN